MDEKYTTYERKISEYVKMQKLNEETFLTFQQMQNVQKKRKTNS